MESLKLIIFRSVFSLVNNLPVKSDLIKTVKSSVDDINPPPPQSKEVFVFFNEYVP